MDKAESSSINVVNPLVYLSVRRNHHPFISARATSRYPDHKTQIVQKSVKNQELKYFIQFRYAYIHILTSGNNTNCIQKTTRRGGTLRVKHNLSVL
jgi:hypothetical protein